MKIQTLLRWTPAVLSLIFTGYQSVIFLTPKVTQVPGITPEASIQASETTVSGDQQLLDRLLQEQLDLQAQLESLPVQVHPDYETLLVQAAADAEQEFLHHHPAFALARQSPDDSERARTKLRAELNVMRYVLGPLTKMDLPQATIDEWIPMLVEAEVNWQEHVQQYRAGQIPQLDPEIQQAQLLIRELMGERRAGVGPNSGSIPTPQSNEYGRIATELTEAAMRSALLASTLTVSPELSDATRRIAVDRLHEARVSRPPIEQLSSSSDPRAIMTQHTRNQFLTLRDQFRDEYTGEELAALERMMDDQILQWDVGDVANARRAGQR